MSSRPARAPRLRPDERRAGIVSAAVRIAGRRSLAALSTAEVAAEAGVSKAAIFRYFPERDKLVGAVLDEVERFYVAILDRAQAGSEDPVRTLVNLSIAYAASLETHFDYAKIVLSWSAFVEEPRIVSRLGRIFMGYVERVEQTIRRGIGMGKLSREIDVELAAWTFVGYSSTVGAAKFFGRPPEWIYHLQLALLRNLLGHEAIDRVLAASRPSPLTSDRPRQADRGGPVRFRPLRKSP